MFEKLNRARNEEQKALKKFNEAKSKLEKARANVKDAEASEILSIVAEKKMTPEELFDLLKNKTETGLVESVAANKPLFGRNLDKEELLEDEND